MHCKVSVNLLPSRVEFYLLVGVLPAFKARVAQQLLDGVVQAAIKKNKALTAVEEFGKVCPLYSLWDVRINGLARHCGGLAVSDVL